MDERGDKTLEQFDNDEIQGEPSQAGYPEEQPAAAVPKDTEGGAAQTERRSGAERIDSGDSPPGAYGEGSQSTGNPDAAG